MKLKTLTISLNQYSWEGPEGMYKGKVSFFNETGEIELNLNHELSQRILDVVADELVASSKQMANDITRNIIEQAASVPQIEGDGTG